MRHGDFHQVSRSRINDYCSSQTSSFSNGQYSSAGWAGGSGRSSWPVIEIKFYWFVSSRIMTYEQARQEVLARYQ